VGPCLDYTLFLDVDKRLCRSRVIDRKVCTAVEVMVRGLNHGTGDNALRCAQVRNGRLRESAEEHYDRVDGPIYDR
jgi:hypothetical protein